MTNSNQTFLEKMESHITANLNNEQFGVKQLSEMMGINRSHLHRKLKKTNGKSISRFIREYRLEKAKKILLEKKEITASEVSYIVGFGSPTYFNKCFTEYFGYSPGKIRLHTNDFPADTESINTLNKNSIIVLPFKNLSEGKKNQYLADGMVDAISRHLSGIDGLKVISTLASTNLNSMIEIREKLGVAKIVQGSLQRQDHIIRIEIKLLNTIDGNQIWAESYDRKILDILEIQNSISKNIVSKLGTTLSTKEQSILKKRTSYNPLAYDNYLKGMYHMNNFGDKGMDQSLLFFEKAITIDASMAPAYAAIANYYQMKASIFSATINSKDAFKKAEQYLDFALKLDKDWHFNFTIKGFQLTFFHWNFKDAHKNYKKGLKASKPLSYIMYRDFLQLENRHKKGLEIALKISKETPFYPNAPLIMSYYYNNMYKEGEAYIKERLEAFPTHYLMYDNAGFFMLNTGNYKKAIKLFKQLIKKENKILPRAFGWMAAAYAHSGNTEKAIEILNKLKAIKKKTHAGSPAWFIAVIYAALGKKTDALAWISVAIKAQELEVPWLVSEPQFYFLHGTTEFNTLVKKVRFSKHAYPVKLPKHQIISLNNG